MSLRTDKVASVIHQVVAQIINENVRYPHTTVTITRVQVSPDLKHAAVWLSIYGQDTARAAAEILDMQKEYSRRVATISTTKFSPKLRFHFDTSAEYADKINRLINAIK